MTPAPSTARWPISEAPASLNIKLKIGNMEIMFTMRDVDDLKLQRRATLSLPWLQEILHGCEANLAARQQAEAERQVQARSLDEQIAAAVQAAMQAQTAASRDGVRMPASSEEHTERTAATHETDPGWCPKHQVTMRWDDGNARGPGWFSHQLADGSYCKGK